MPRAPGSLSDGSPPQGNEIRDLPRLDAVALAHLGRADSGHLAGPDRLQDGRPPGRKLERVAIAARHDGGPAARLLGGNGGGEEVVGLVARRLRIREAAGGDELRQNLELVDQLGIELAPALITREGLVPVRRSVERVPADDHGTGLFAKVEAEQEIREADDRAAALVAAAPDRLRQAVKGAMREGIAVDHQQRPAHSTSGGGVLQDVVLGLSSGGLLASGGLSRGRSPATRAPRARTQPCCRLDPATRFRAYERALEGR